MIIECEKLVNECKLTRCCQLTADMDNILRNLPSASTAIGSGAVCTILRRENKFLKSRVISKLRRLLNECVHFEYGRVCVTKQLTGMLKSEDIIIDEPLDLSELWKCITQVSKTEEFVEDILKSLWRFVISPLWKEKKAQSASISSSANRAEFIFENIAREQSVYLSREMTLIDGCKVPA